MKKEVQDRLEESDRGTLQKRRTGGLEQGPSTHVISLWKVEPLNRWGADAGGGEHNG